MNSGPRAPGDVVEDALPKAALPERRVGLLVQLEPPRHREKILLREPRAPSEQKGMRLPEASMDRGELGKLRCEISAGM